MRAAPPRSTRANRSGRSTAATRPRRRATAAVYDRRSFLRAGYVGERFAREPERLPVVHRPCSDSFVECYRKLVPGEHRPVQTPAITLDRDARELAQQRKADAVLPRWRSDEKIFQIDSAFAEPGRIVVEEKGEPSRRVAEVGDQ